MNGIGIGIQWNIAVAAKSLQSCPTLCDPIDGSLPVSPVPGILQARTLEWIAISFSNAWKWKMKVKSLSRVWLPATPWTAAYQAPLSMGFSRQEYWSGLPSPSPTVEYYLAIKMKYCCLWQMDGPMQSEILEKDRLCVMYVWNLKNKTSEQKTKQKQTHRYRETQGCQREGNGGHGQNRWRGLGGTHFHL